jgi:hypothetical protein
LLAGFHSEADRRAFLSSDFHIRKHGDAHNIQSIQSKKTSGDGHSFYRLVNRPSADCLNLGATLVADNSCYGAGNSRCPGLGCNSDDIGHLDASWINP